MIETKTYPDGTTATGLRPLPILSPSDLTDEEILSIAEWPQFNMEEVHREVVDFARAVIAAALDKKGPQFLGSCVRRNTMLSPDDAERLHRLPFVRAAMLQYVERPNDQTATAMVQAISAQVVNWMGS